MKISIITVTFNSAATVGDTLKSVAAQDYPEIEHLVIDGASKDNTLEVVKRFSHVAKVVSEPDKGMYDGLNKGIALATGEVIGILNSDDVLHDPTIISQIAAALQDREIDAVYGDIRFIAPDNRNKTTRYYSSAHFHPGKFEWGYMPAHPSFYCRKSVYDQFGGFQVDYKIAADYEWLTRVMYKHRIRCKYLPLLTVDMLPGGLSNGTMKRRWVLNKEIIRGCAENGVQTNMLKLSLKYFRKIFEYLKKP